MVADPHGTQMASLITEVNPFCRLYIARVGKARKDILPENAAKVQFLTFSLDVPSTIMLVRGQHTFFVLPQTA